MDRIFLSFIAQTTLFQGCSEKDILNLEKHFNFRTAEYKKEDMILCAGSIVTDIGLILSGSVRIEYTDLWGNKSILGITPAGSVFAESYACIPNEPMMVDAMANEKCDILFISVPRLFMPCPVCESQNRLIQNLVVISAGKICSFPDAVCTHLQKQYGDGCFLIFHRWFLNRKTIKIILPFDRQQLADYLNIDRSALSKELGKMKKDGLIEYHKNFFEIKIDIK